MKRLRKSWWRPFTMTTQWLTLFWNIGMGFFHIYVFHFPFITALLSQVIAFGVEYSLSAPYQRLAFKYDNKIILYAKTVRMSKIFCYLLRYASFLVVYWMIFLSSYIARMWILSRPPIAAGLKWFTLKISELTGYPSNGELITKDINRAIIISCLLSFVLALAIPLSVMLRHWFIKKWELWRVSLKRWFKWNTKQSKKDSYWLRSFSSLHIADR